MADTESSSSYKKLLDEGKAIAADANVISEQTKEPSQIGSGVSNPTVTINGNIEEDVYYNKRVYLGNLDHTSKHEGMYANSLFFPKNMDWYSKVNRYGWINPYDHDRVLKEFLFFTKPDLHLFTGGDDMDASGNIVCPGAIDPNGNSTNGFINDVAHRMPKVLTQLVLDAKDPSGRANPFMYLLTNAVTSKLDLPTISADSQESTANMLGSSIQYRGHSMKSDFGYDFSLSFTDTAYLEIYSLAKVYDEYMRMLRLGEIYQQDKYILSKIIPEQFSIYKFLIGSDGETILYYAKLTGCYFVDVPRSDLSDPSEEIKFSLSFHAQFVEDMNPYILTEFNKVASKGFNYAHSSSYMPVSSYGNPNYTVNNRWGKYPRIIRADKTDPVYGKRVARRWVEYDYFLKWYED